MGDISDQTQPGEGRLSNLALKFGIGTSLDPRVPIGPRPIQATLDSFAAALRGDRALCR
jgi:hypothetical protein